MTKRIFAALTFALLLLQPALSQESFADLVKAVQNQNDAQALALSQKLEERGEVSFGLYYNRGLAYRNLKQYSRARASFEKALTFEPRDLKTRRRLSELKQNLSPQLSEMDAQGTPFWKNNEASLVLVCLSLVVLVLGVSKALGKGVGTRQILFFFALYSLSALMFFFYNPAPRRALIVSSGAKLLEKAHSETKGFALTDGLMIKIIDEKGHFLQIKLADGQVGWVRRAEVVEL